MSRRYTLVRADLRYELRQGDRFVAEVRSTTGGVDTVRVFRLGRGNNGVWEFHRQGQDYPDTYSSSVLYDWLSREARTVLIFRAVEGPPNATV